MKRYYSIDFQAMKAAGLNATQWMILEDVHFRQARSESGWCEETRGQMAEDHQLSLAGFKKNIAQLVELGFIKRNNMNHLRTTPKWHAVQECSNHKKNESEEGVTKVDGGYKSSGYKSSRQGVTKVADTSYKKAFRENIPQTPKWAPVCDGDSEIEPAQENEPVQHDEKSKAHATLNLIKAECALLGSKGRITRSEFLDALKYAEKIDDIRGFVTAYKKHLADAGKYAKRLVNFMADYATGDERKPKKPDWVEVM